MKQHGFHILLPLSAAQEGGKSAQYGDKDGQSEGKDEKEGGIKQGQKQEEDTARGTKIKKKRFKKRKPIQGIWIWLISTDLSISIFAWQM